MSRTVPEPLSKAQQEEFLALLDLHHDAFVRYVRAMTRDSEQAREIVAETLLIALERFHTLREPASFLFFLIAIARRLFWRSGRWGRLFLRLEDKHEDLAIDAAAAPDLQPDLRLLHECIGRLPARQREALALFELAGLRLEEIRDLQGGSLSGVKSRIARARKRLAAQLNEREEAATPQRREDSVECIEIEVES